MVVFILSRMRFILMKVSGGNGVEKILDVDIWDVCNEEIERRENKVGLNNGIFIEWWEWLNELFDFDLGRSYERREGVIREIGNYVGGRVIISFGRVIV